MIERLLSGEPPQRLLLATDMSSRSDRAFDRAVLLACAWGAELHIVHALKTIPSVSRAGFDETAFVEEFQDPKTAVLRELGKWTAHTGLPAHVHIEDAPPAQAILAVANREKCDLLILGESRDGLTGIAESTLGHVVRTAPASILAVRSRAHAPYRSLLVGTDFTDEALQALVAAARLFPLTSIVLVHAYQMPYGGLYQTYDQKASWAADMLTQLRAHVQQADLPPERRASIRTLVAGGPPAATLGRYVEDRDADLTVIGAHARGIVFDLLVGNSRSIVGAIPGDVLIVRASGAK